MSLRYLTEDWEANVRDPLRVAATNRTGLIGTGPDDAFDRLTELAVAVIDVPRAFITLVDAERYSFKSSVGLAEGAPRQGLVEQSFCRYVVGLERPFFVEDVANDPRSTDPLLQALGIGAWAGYPVEAPDGMVVGTFCVADTAPRAWADRDLLILATLAKATSSEVALVVLRAQLELARGH